jgi:Na+/H+ antiporter NhaD/arsenite permease-like protein
MGSRDDEWQLGARYFGEGVGGSLLSVGSAAGVALMGQARGVYTFAAHLRWSWAVALGFLASIGMHLLMEDIFRVWG